MGKMIESELDVPKHGSTGSCPLVAMKMLLFAQIRVSV